MAQKKSLSQNNKALLLDLILSAKDSKSLEILLEELLTPQERSMFEARVGITKALLDNNTYEQIETTLGASSSVIARTKREIVQSKSEYIVTFLNNQKPSEKG